MDDRRLVAEVGTIHKHAIMRYDLGIDDIAPNIQRIIRDYELTGEKGEIIREHLHVYEDLLYNFKREGDKIEETNKDYLRGIPILGSLAIGGLVGYTVSEIFDLSKHFILGTAVASLGFEYLVRPLRRSLLGVFCSELVKDTKQNFKDLETRTLEQLKDLPKA